MNLYMSMPQEEKKFYALSFYKKFKRLYKDYFDQFKSLEDKINGDEGKVL